MTDDIHSPGLAALGKVVEDGIDHMLVEYPPVAVTKQVKFQALELKAGRGGNIMDDDRTEIGLARLRAYRGKFRARDLDLVFTIRELVRKGFHRAGHLVYS